MAFATAHISVFLMNFIRRSRLWPLMARQANRLSVIGYQLGSSAWRTREGLSWSFRWGSDLFAFGRHDVGAAHHTVDSNYDRQGEKENSDSCSAIAASQHLFPPSYPGDPFTGPKLPADLFISPLSQDGYSEKVATSLFVVGLQERIGLPLNLQLKIIWNFRYYGFRWGFHPSFSGWHRFS